MRHGWELCSRQLVLWWWLGLTGSVRSQNETLLTGMPTLTSSSTTSVASIPVEMGAGMHAEQAYSEEQSYTSSVEAALSSVEATLTATAPWETSTTAMTPFTDSEDTVVVHSDGGITLSPSTDCLLTAARPYLTFGAAHCRYGCPEEGDEWIVEDLTDSLSAHTATGAGCYMLYSFKGDGMQIYGATGTDGGVFGCSVSASGRNYTGWWNAYADSNTYKPYEGSCALQGLGWDDHTLQLVNSPCTSRLYCSLASAYADGTYSTDQPGKVWFTGLRFTTNQSGVPWQTHTWDACCASYTFPSGVATTVDSEPTATTTSSSATIAGMAPGTALFVVCGLGAVIILATLLVTMMCCKKRPASDNKAKTALSKALVSDSEDSAASQPRHGRKRNLGRHRGQHDREDESGLSDTGSNSSSSRDRTASDSEDEERAEKRKKRGRRRR